MSKLFALILLAVLIAVAVVIGVNTGNHTNNLASVEVREYQGENLSSVNDIGTESIKGTQNVGVDSYRLNVSGLVENQSQYKYDQVINDHTLYKKVATLSCVDGWSAKILWEGVLVKDLLNEAGVLPNATVVIFHAADGYTTSLPIDYILNNNIIMAYKMNGVVLPAALGFPFQLVAESKWGYKWIRWITGIEVSDSTSYEGYWESRGFSNSGDLNESFFH
jgi:DMSO/TMAO reductase YedYZ molybdopterin-dependent catalytic subunit